jgi:predicted TIM-barrel fold metal-dependent hydrolase
LQTVGADRFLFGSAWPLRLVQSPIASLDLLPLELRPLLVAEVP